MEPGGRITGNADGPIHKLKPAYFTVVDFH